MKVDAKLVGFLLEFAPIVFQVSQAVRERLPLDCQLIQSSLMVGLPAGFAVCEFVQAALDLGVLLLDLRFSLGKLIATP